MNHKSEMVSDYKFHLFCKRLKKEKWRLSKDLSPAMMLLIFHYCWWMSRLWEPSVGCTELPGRSPLARQLALRTPLQDAPARANAMTGCPRCLPHVQQTSAPSQAPLLPSTSLHTLLMGYKTRLTFAEREINITSGKGRTKTVSVCGKYYLLPAFRCQEKYQRNCFLGKTQRFE